jgi:5'-nucleotidase
VLDLASARGFVFDVDGTLAHRGPDGRARPAPGAVELLERIRASGRPLALFTNGSHVPSAAIAAGLREDGLPVADEEMLTPTDSAIAYLRARHPHTRVLLFGSDPLAEHVRSAGVELTTGEDAQAVYVAHRQRVELDEIERAARAVVAGAPLLTASYVRGYAGADGIIFSRGAMVTAAIAKVTGARPRVLGKPSRAAVREIVNRLGIPAAELVVVGDDLDLDIALGRLGGSRTILVRSGVSGEIERERVLAGRRPDAAVGGVSELLDWL